MGPGRFCSFSLTKRLRKHVVRRTNIETRGGPLPALHPAYGGGQIASPIRCTPPTLQIVNIHANLGATAVTHLTQKGGAMICRKVNIRQLFCGHLRLRGDPVERGADTTPASKHFHICKSTSILQMHRALLPAGRSGWDDWRSELRTSRSLSTMRWCFAPGEKA